MSLCRRQWAQTSPGKADSLEEDVFAPSVGKDWAQRFLYI